MIYSTLTFVSPDVLLQVGAVSKEVGVAVGALGRPRADLALHLHTHT